MIRHFETPQVSLAETTDFIEQHGDALIDLTDVLEFSRKHDEAGEAVKQALSLYERKGNIVSAGKARDRLAELRETAPSAP